MDTTTEAQKSYMKIALERSRRKPVNYTTTSATPSKITPCYGCPAWKGALGMK